MTWVHIEDTSQIARKIHHCYLCGKPILPKNRYIKRFGISEGAKHSFKMHEHCEYATRSWSEDDWLYTDIWEFNYSELGDRRNGQ